MRVHCWQVISNIHHVRVFAFDVAIVDYLLVDPAWPVPAAIVVHFA